MQAPVVSVQNLNLSIGDAHVLNAVNLDVMPGQIHGLIGESGSGKSMTALAIMGLLPHRTRTTGAIMFGEKNLLKADERTLCTLRGDDIGMVFQEPMTALNPVKTIGEQVAEGIRFHTGMSRANAERHAIIMLDRVGLPQAQFPLSRYPHELSGGQRQRVVIAIACALSPKLLIADEPTTALDVVLQKQILDLLRTLVDEQHMGLILISHDLGVVADMADTLTILRHGAVQESGEIGQLFSQMAHPYTRQLAEASTHVPQWQKRNNPPQATQALLTVNNLSRVYGRHKGLLRRHAGFTAVDDVSFEIAAGRSVGLVGRSGCGKSTLARMVLALDAPTSGTITLDGQTITNAPPSALNTARRKMQVVFQDPYGSFNPRRTVEKLISEPLHLDPDITTRAKARERVAEALREVAMDPAVMDRYPHEFSGGQRQRLAIARAIITRPKLIVADEPVSALDVSIRAQILDLFAKLNDDLDIAFLFITHDLAVARAITHETMVMDAGKIVERNATNALLDNPCSAAAQKLVQATPDLARSIARRTS